MGAAEQVAASALEPVETEVGKEKTPPCRSLCGSSKVTAGELVDERAAQISHFSAGACAELPAIDKK